MSVVSSYQQFLPDEPRIKEMLKSHCIKAKWSPDEDEQLKEAVNKFGTSNWYAISTYVSTRSGKQCRERWIGQICPDLSRENWTYDEDMLLIRLQNENGNKWTSISNSFTNRSPINIKNRWYWLLRHRIPQNASKKPESRQQIQTKQSFIQSKAFKPLEFDDSRIFGRAFDEFSKHLLAGIGL